MSEDYLQTLIERWIATHPLSLEESPYGQPRLVWHLTDGGEWSLLQILLHLPQVMAEQLNCRIVLMMFQKLAIASEKVGTCPLT